MTTTKKVRASKLTAGQSINGQRIARVSVSFIHPGPGAMPTAQVTVHFAPSADPDAAVLAVYGASEWVAVDRTA